jgi:hypothetical protein
MLFRKRFCKRQAPHPSGPTNCIKDSAFYNKMKKEHVRPAEYKQDEEKTIKIQ